MSLNRGVITNPDRARQLRDYSGLKFGTITPTDIDGFIEYQGKAHIFIELKHGSAPLPDGQQLAYERLIDDDIGKTNKPAIVIVATHHIDDPQLNINVADAVVDKYRWNGNWHYLTKTTTVKTLIKSFINFINDSSGGY